MSLKSSAQERFYLNRCAAKKTIDFIVKLQFHWFRVVAPIAVVGLVTVAVVHDSICIVCFLLVVE